MRIRESKKIRLAGRVLFVLYLAFMVYFLCFAEWYGRQSMEEFRYNTTLFTEIRRFWVYRDKLGFFSVMTNLAGNLLIFVPFGFFIPIASRYRRLLDVVLFSFGFSLCMETFQFFSKIGIFDVDDLLLNTLGGIVGYILFAICNRIRRRYVTGKKRKN